VDANAGSFTMPTAVNFGSSYFINRTAAAHGTDVLVQLRRRYYTELRHHAREQRDHDGAGLLAAVLYARGSVSGLTSGTLVLANGSDHRERPPATVVFRCPRPWPTGRAMRLLC